MPLCIIVFHYYYPLQIYLKMTVFFSSSSATLSLYMSHFSLLSFLPLSTISLNFCSLFHPFSFTPLFVFPICHLTPLIPSCQLNGVSLHSLSPFFSLASLSVFSSSRHHSLFPVTNSLFIDSSSQAFQLCPRRALIMLVWTAFVCRCWMQQSGTWQPFWVSIIMGAIPGLPPETQTFSDIVRTYDARLQPCCAKHSPTSTYKQDVQNFKITQISQTCKFYQSCVAWKHVM